MNQRKFKSVVLILLAISMLARDVGCLSREGTPKAQASIPPRR